MNWITQLRKRQDLCDDLSEEIRAHLAEKTSELIDRGMSPAEAASAARREFGNATLVEERGRETWHWISLEDFLIDLRYGARALRKNPGFTLVALLTLALGIGANSAIFSLVDAVLLRPLPFAQPERLVSLSEKNWYPQGGFVAMRTTLQTMEVAAYEPGVEFNLTRQGEAERLTGTEVSANFFSLLGVQPELGRIFQSGEDQPGKNSKVILSHSLWQRKFYGDPGVIGRQIMLGDDSREVVGVMPEDFRPGFSETELWVPLNLDPAGDGYWRAQWVPVIGRLKEGESRSRAQAEVQLMQQRLLTMFPWKMPAGTWDPASVIPLQQKVVGDVRTRLLILLGAIGLVLLIACANVANLLLARAATRQREMAVRATLGAGRWRICRQLLTESTLLGVAGAALGSALAYFGISWLKATLPVGDIPRLATVSMDVRVLLFTAAIGVLTGLIFGLAPALQLCRVDLTESLKTGSKNAVAVSHRLRSGLAVSEIALSVVLVTAAGLMVKSLWQLVHVDPGFRSESILSARLTPNQAFCDDFHRCQSFYYALLDRVRAMPGVQSAALVNALPLTGRIGFIAARFEDHPQDFEGKNPEPLLFDSIVTPDYLSAMQIPLLQGRNFVASDTSPNAEPVVLVTASTAHRYWPGQDAIGKHVRAAWQKQWRTVVGVVADVHEDTLATTLPAWIEGAIYEPYSEHAELITQRPAVEMSLIVRGTSGVENFAGALREAVANLNREVPVTEVETLRGVVSDSVSAPRSTMSLFAIFAALALMLGAIGVYGVISYSVAQRTSEIGVRMALGAQQRDIRFLILAHGVRIAALGVGIGIAGALVLTRLMSKLLYGVTATDPMTFMAVALLLTAIALVACYIPARRAMRLDPSLALRYE